MDGLALRKHVRVLFVRGLSWRHPLKCGTLIGSSDLDLNIDGLAFGNLGWKRNGKRTAIGLHTIANVELDTFTLDFYDGDVKEAMPQLLSCSINSATLLYLEYIPAIQYNIFHLLIRQTLQRQHYTSKQPLLLEIDIKIDTRMPGHKVVIVRQGVWVPWGADLNIRIRHWLCNHSGGGAMHRGERCCSRS